MMASTFTALNPEGYEKIMGRFSRRLAHAFIDFSGSAPGETILDVGCGTGSMTAALAEPGNHTAIVGIDVSEPYVAFARARNKDSRITFDIGDVVSLPYPSGHFDRAVSQLVLMFLPDPSPAVAEMRRVVRPGGTVAACVWDGFGGQPHVRMLWDTASALGLDRSRSLFRPLNTAGELAAMWRKVGLVDVEEDTITTRFEYANFDDYWSPFLSGDGPPGQMVMGLTPDQRSMLERQVRHVYLSGRPDGPRSFIGAAWICKGIVPASS
jgi:SAM-dependent methyltransferase